MSDSIVIALSLVFMAVFSAAETSFVSADKIALIINPFPGVKSKSVLFFLQNNEMFFATVVVATNLFVTVFSSVSEVFLHSSLGMPFGLVVVLTTVTGFLIGELIPKSAAVENPESTARFLLPLVRGFSTVMAPVVRMTAVSSSFIAKTVFRSRSSSGSLMFQRRDVYRFLGSTVSSGYLDKIESEMIRRLLTNASLSVRNIAVPRTEIVATGIGTKIEKLRDTFEKTRKTKVIIYDADIDNVVGVVHAKDIFKNVERVDEILSDVLFVPENMSVVDLLDEFRAEKVYVAILIDEFGGTSGLVTSSDVMELFLGDVAVWASEEKVKESGRGQYVVKGNAEIGEVEKGLGIRLPGGEFSTLAGFIISKLGRIPLRGDVFMIGKLEIKVLESDGRRVGTLKITLR